MADWPFGRKDHFVDSPVYQDCALIITADCIEDGLVLIERDDRFDAIAAHFPLRRL